MATPYYETISEASLMASANLELAGFNGTLDDILLKNFLWQAVKELRTPLFFEKKICTIDICDGRGKLPCDWVRQDPKGGVFVTDPNLPTAPGGYAIESNAAFPREDPGPWGWGWWCNVATYQFIDGYIVFNDSVEVNQVKISYTAVRTDDEGNILIPASHERGIVNFMKWQYSLTFHADFPENVRSSYYNQWRLSKRANKGWENLPSAGERTMIAIIMNRMVG